MNILLTNDDGFQSAGLVEMCQGLTQAGHKVYVVAPDIQRSGFSHYINFHKNIKFSPLKDFPAAEKAYSCSGSPSDCVKFAILRLGVKFDIVISGPNDGENYGYDILYSGTVGAAEEALICGVKAIAISRLGFGGPYTQCVQYLVQNLQKLSKFDQPEVLININVPNLPLEQIKGVVVVPQGKNLYNDFYVDALEDNWRLEGEKLASEMHDCDVTLANEGYITLTPITISQTHHQSLGILKDLLEK